MTLPLKGKIGIFIGTWYSAPLVEANDKYYARIKVLKTLCEKIEKVLEK